MINIKNVKKLDNVILKSFTDHNYIAIIDNETYYLKDLNNFSLNELVASEVYRLLNIPCVFYTVVSVDDKLYLMSKSFMKDDKKYYLGEQLINDYLKNGNKKYIDNELYEKDNIYKRNNLELIWDMLEYRYPVDDKRHNCIRSVMVNLIKQYVMSIMLLDADYNSVNWMLEEDLNNVKVTPKFDNECAFTWDIYGMSFGVNKDDFGSSFESINTYLNYSAQIDKNIFLDIYDKLTPDLLNKAINNVKLMFNIDNMEKEEKRIINIFNEVRKSLDMMVNERGLKR